MAKNSSESIFHNIMSKYYSESRQSLAEIVSSDVSVFGLCMAFLSCFVVAKTTLFFWNFQKFKEKIDLIPGMRRVFLVGNFHQGALLLYQSLYPTNAFLIIIASALCKLYPETGICRAWIFFRPFVVVFKAKTVEPLLNSNVHLEKSKDYDFLKSWLKTGLLTSGGKKWKQRRKMLTPSFHFRILEEFQPIISEHSHELVKQLNLLPDLFTPDLMSQVTLTTLDIIAETAMGVNVGAQSNKYSPYVQALLDVSFGSMYRVGRPWLWNEFLFSFSSVGKKSRKALQVLHTYSKNVIDERKKTILSEELTKNSSRQEVDVSGKRRLAFLDMLLQEHFKDKSFTESHIQEEVDTFMFEGHDTTSAGVCWCLYLLGHNPLIQEKAYEELLTVFGPDKDTPITSHHLKEMKYLDCVIKEAQRLYPSVPVVARKLYQDLKIDDVVIPTGTNCYIVPPIIHRDEEYFPNPEVFDPDRFLPENCNGRHPFAYIPFSAGPRNCIGQKFAMNEEKTLISNVLRNFKMTSLDHRDIVIICAELTSRPTPSIRMQFQRR